MKKGFLFCLVLFVIVMVFATGCTGNQPESTPADSLADSTAIVDSLAKDSINTDTVEVAPIPVAADQLFDDFLFLFASRPAIQLSRIKFPITETTGDKTRQIDRQHWVMERFFTDKDFYTLIFDNQQQMKAANDRHTDSVAVETINLNTGVVRQHLFTHATGKWMLVEIRNKLVSETKNATFLDFYNKFATNPAYRRQSISNPFVFVGPDPNDDFGDRVKTMQMRASQWDNLGFDDLPSGTIYNILYGQRYTESNQKIFVLRGNANDQETELTFRRFGSRWMLVKLNV